MRKDNSEDQAICVTRSFLKHDLTHFAVESEANLKSGFWGLISAGKSLADLNDRTGQSLAGEVPQLMVIEGVVGALHNIDQTKPVKLYEGLVAQGDGLGWEIPA